MTNYPKHKICPVCLNMFDVRWETRKKEYCSNSCAFSHSRDNLLDHKEVIISTDLGDSVL